MTKERERKKRKRREIKKRMRDELINFKTGSVYEFGSNSRLKMTKK